MFVVDISSTGAEILCLMVPAGKACLLVKLLCGTGEASDVFDPVLRLPRVVKALDSDMLLAEYYEFCPE